MICVVKISYRGDMAAVDIGALYGVCAFAGMLMTSTRPYQRSAQDQGYLVMHLSIPYGKPYSLTT
ncbi:hypothetical protein KQH34_16505 [Erwinia amylovora]|uniref:Uncharacterized protein n=4 Tax=Erwinia amylovora TaxID=552 RepID=A0A831A0L9_ERWAM|nr:hypothetical protein AD997_10875 [Erwinia amylovora]EKV54919.1 hypothetical protein EaACW_2227 [Erwinia amylovora ACW56400]CBA21285.1 hypothetical protein predicted by Glimmer/Critica [Erwinia amylovora CFBP1430]CBX81089.1 hypothetical protein predicted by Glimmer/Critica [Erwinia amylovora ATCC BAA-2158]CCO79071.1 hypothetical protein BN432_2283 [Erwinia amylovora Ea356]CCO82876.1 hypothetical protein BN433_2315 [Erwinia amylovora Ea266]CCO86647.1 hypothetical protein BN434_2268 [Erwinia 